MAEDRLTIDTVTIFDNVNDRRVEFAGEASGERYAFAAQYDLLEALAAETPDERPVQLFQRHAGRIARAGVTALARDPDQALVVISENDL